MAPGQSRIGSLSMNNGERIAGELGEFGGHLHGMSMPTLQRTLPDSLTNAPQGHIRGAEWREAQFDSALARGTIFSPRQLDVGRRPIQRRENFAVDTGAVARTRAAMVSPTSVASRKPGWWWADTTSARVSVDVEHLSVARQAIPGIQTHADPSNVDQQWIRLLVGFDRTWSSP